jgi:hypothetical protein
VKTVSAWENPASANSPTGRSGNGHHLVKALEATIPWPSFPVSFSRRTARLTAHADAGEIEPLVAADFAVLDLAEMEREAEAHALARRRGVKRGDGSARLMGGGERRTADIGRVLSDRKNRHQAVIEKPRVTSRIVHQWVAWVSTSRTRLQHHLRLRH